MPSAGSIVSHQRSIAFKVASVVAWGASLSVSAGAVAALKIQALGFAHGDGDGVLQ